MTKELELALEHFEHEIAAAEEHRRNLGSGGMRVPFFGDFADVPPSGLKRLRWHLNDIREAAK